LLSQASAAHPAAFAVAGSRHLNGIVQESHERSRHTSPPASVSGGMDDQPLIMLRSGRRRCLHKGAASNTAEVEAEEAQPEARLKRIRKAQQEFNNDGADSDLMDESAVSEPEGKTHQEAASASLPQTDQQSDAAHQRFTPEQTGKQKAVETSGASALAHSLADSEPENEPQHVTNALEQDQHSDSGHQPFTPEQKGRQEAPVTHKDLEEPGLSDLHEGCIPEKLPYLQKLGPITPEQVTPVGPPKDMLIGGPSPRRRHLQRADRRPMKVCQWTMRMHQGSVPYH